MRLVNLTILLFIISSPCSAGAGDVLWKWDDNGATDVLFIDGKCECYYSVSFSEKVTPQPGRRFVLSGSQSQIVTSKLDEFISGPSIPAGAEDILRTHLKYEHSHLQGVVGDAGINLVSATYNGIDNSLTWVLERPSKSGVSVIVSTSIVSDKCVVYVSSLVDSVNSVERIASLQAAIMQSLSLHRPTSQKEAESILSRYIDD